MCVQGTGCGTPSVSGSGSALFGATVQGQVNRVRLTQAVSVAAEADDDTIVVRIAGTSLTTEVGPDGWFVFTSVAPGNVQLIFISSGLEESVWLEDVEAGETVTIVVVVNGGHIELESETREGGDDFPEDEPDGDEPDGDGDEPDGEGDEPDGDGDEPDGEGDEPDGEGDEPDGEGDEPDGEGDEPDGEGDEPDGEGDEPAGEGDEPDGEGDEPDGEGDEPDGDGDEPDGEGDEPAGEGDEPAGEGDEPDED